MSDLLSQALLLQTRQRPRQSASSRLAEQLMRQAGQQGPAYGTVGVLARALPAIAGGYFAQRGEQEERQAEEANFNRLRDLQREQNAEAASFFRPQAAPAPMPQMAPPQASMAPMPNAAPQAGDDPRAMPGYDPMAESRRRLAAMPQGPQERPGGYRAPAGVDGAFAGLAPPTGVLAPVSGMPAATPQAPGLSGLPPGVTMDMLAQGLAHPNPQIRQQAQAMIQVAQLARRETPNPVTVGPGASLVDLRTGRPIFTAPERPDEFQRLLAMSGVTPNTPEAQALARQVLERRGQPPQTTVNVPQMGTIPPGFRAEYDEAGRPTRLVPIEGGPAARQEARDQRADTARETGTRRTGNVVITDIDRALNLLDRSVLPAAGLGAGTMAAIPGTAARDVGALLDTIRANVGFAQLNQMRAESPTGGALGQVTERELAFLQAVLGNLDQSQSPAQFRRNLVRLREVYDEIINGPPPAPPQAGEVPGPSPGTTATPPPAPSDAPARPQRFRFNPATGAVEPAQ